MRAALRIALCLLAAPSFGAGVEVISPRPDAVSVTIYRDLFALITETRTVDLPEGEVTLSFDGVVETLLPASTVLTGTDRELAERNYDYDELTPSALFEKSVGRKVLLTRTSPGTGVVRQVEATVVAAHAGGIVFQTADGAETLHCSGVPEHVTFEQVPDDLHAKPRLSVHLAAGSAGKRTIKLSYLAHGFAWKSDYVARLDGPGTRADLRGWVTLRNLTNATLRDAQVQVVAGRLHLLGDDSDGTSVVGDTDEIGDEMSLRSAREEALESMQEEMEPASPDLQLFTGCFSEPLVAEDIGRFPDKYMAEALQRVSGVDLEEVTVTGFRASQAEHERLADYHLYRIPWPTDLNARQTKQVVFLQKPAVKVRRFYRAFVNAIDYYPDPDDEVRSAQSMFGFENRKSSGLGEALPEGILRLYEKGNDTDLFAGEGQMNDTAEGEPVELIIAHAVDLTFELTVDEGTEEDRHGDEIAALADATLRINNARGAPVEVEVRQSMASVQDATTITRASQRTFRKFGDYAWTVRVPPNATGTLTYRVRLQRPPERETD